MRHRSAGTWTFGFAIVLVFGVLAAGGGEDLTEVRVRGVAADPITETPVVVLEDLVGEHVLPIWVGISEARAIAMELGKLKPPRPMTHDLMTAILEGMQGKIERVVIHDLRDNTYYAEISLIRGDERFVVDSRPSDAIALAVRVDAPIFAARRLMEPGAEYGELERSTRDQIAGAFGFYPQELTEALAEYFHVEGKKGLLVSEVLIDTIADEAGLRRGDVILKVSGRPVNDVEELGGILLAAHAGEVIAIDVLRGEEAISVELHPR